MSNYLWAWGSNAGYVFGNDNETNSRIPIQIGNNGWNTISCRLYHSLGIKNDGTLWGWGANSGGQLGLGNIQVSTTPTQIGNDNTWLKVACHTYRSAAIKNDGSLWVFGAGYIGNGTDTGSDAPIQIGSNRSWIDVASGDYHTLVLANDGKLYGWGNNIRGELGDGTNIGKTEISLISSDTWMQISANGSHSIGIKNDGSLWTWGDGSNGEMGNGTNNTTNLNPIQIGIGNTWSKIAAGSYHCLALDVNGTIWAWGINTYGQLGDNTNTNSNAPIQLPYVWSDIACGGNHSLAIRNDGTLWVWGLNNAGQLGNDTISNANYPIKIANQTSKIFGADFASFAINLTPEITPTPTPTITPTLTQTPTITPTITNTTTPTITTSITPTKTQIGINNSNILLNQINITNLRLGSNTINKAYLGDKIIFGNFTPTPTPSNTTTITPTTTLTVTPTLSQTPTITPTPGSFILTSFENAQLICAMALDVSNNKLYINNCGSSGGETNNVIVFDLNSKSVVNNLIVGRTPQHINIGGTKAIVSNVYHEDQTSSLIDLLTYNITTINRVNQVGLGLPGPSIIDTTNNKLFIPEYGGLVVRDLTNLNIITTISNNFQLSGMEFTNINNNTNKLYCSKVYSNELFIIDTVNNTIITAITFDPDDNICGIACNKTTNKTYISIVNGDQTELRIAVIENDNSVSQNIIISNISNLISYSQPIVCDELNNIIYIARNNTTIRGSLYQINGLTNFIIGNTTLAENALDIVYNPNDNKIYAIVDFVGNHQLQEISIN